MAYLNEFEMLNIILNLVIIDLKLVTLVLQKSPKINFFRKY